MRRLVFTLILSSAALAGCKDAGQPQSDAPEALGTTYGGSGSAQAKRAGPGPGPAPTAGEAEGRAYAPADDAIAYDREPAYAEPYPEEESRGLGTAYGESRQSAASTAPFVRAKRRPETVLALWYDDAVGIRRAVDIEGGYYDGIAWVQSDDGMLSLSLIDEYGQGLPAVQLDDRRYAVGEVGQRYLIGVQNDGPERVEAVASVDGLDVIDGQTASYKQRGYIVEPYTSMVIEGWRTSMDTVAAFRFSEIEDSYAERKGESRNIGVIGVAFFREKEHRGRREIRRRKTADPFPGR